MTEEQIIKELEKIEIPKYETIKFNNPRIIYSTNNNEDNNNNINADYSEEKSIETTIKRSCDLSIENFIQNISLYLDDIFSVNDNVTIHKIKLIKSSDTHELVIYSDKPLNTTYLNNKIINRDDSRYSEYKIHVYNSYNLSINKSINKIFEEQQICQKNCIPVSKVIYEFVKHLNNINSLTEKIDQQLVKKIKSSSFYNSKYKEHKINKGQINIHFKFDTNTLQFSINYDTYIFKIDNNNNIVPLTNFNSENISFLKEIKKEIANTFKFYLDNKNLILNNQNIYQLPIVNANCLIFLEDDKIIASFKDEASHHLSIYHTPNDLANFTYKFSNNKLFETVLMNNEIYYLYDNMFVKTDDCPNFLKEKLNEQQTSSNKLKDNITNTIIYSDSNSKIVKTLKKIYSK